MFSQITLFDKQLSLSDIPPGLLYAFGTVATSALLLKIYLKWTTGRHRIEENLAGKVVLITGGTAGIGKESARELARHGATVHILARNLKKAETVAAEIRRQTGNDNVHIHYIDLSDFTTVRAFTEKFLKTKSPIHILINNAGLINFEKKITVDGIEETMQANHLSHFLLTNQLLGRIIESQPSRIINVTSLAHAHASDLDFSDVNFDRQKYTVVRSYSWSKLANVLYTRELARRTYGKGVTVNSVHPGSVKTEIGRNFPLSPLLILLLPMTLFTKTSSEGAQTVLYLATSNKVANVSGCYFVDCRPHRMHLKAWDDQLCLDMWRKSEELTSKK